MYTKMVNSMTVEAVSSKILPLKRENINKQDNSLVDKYDGAVFMPDVKTAFDHIVPAYVSGFIYGALVESYCSEHNARMMAMQNASDSASEMIKICLFSTTEHARLQSLRKSVRFAAELNILKMHSSRLRLGLNL